MAEIYWPFATTTVSEWPGTRGSGWADHVGTDFAIPQGTPLKAAMAGTVDIHWTDGLGAWVIDIISPDGTVVRNGHLSYMAVADGEWVDVGDYIGNTGGAAGSAGAGLSTGPHLHWEIRNNTGWGAWGWYDPRNLKINSFGATASAKPGALSAATSGRTKSMATLFYKTSNNKRAGQGGTNPTYALAGDSPGTEANWNETTDAVHATDLARVHGNAVFVTKDSYAYYQKKYTSPVKTR